MERLLELLSPISQHVVALDLSDPAGAEKDLNTTFPPGSESMRELADLARKAAEAGEICDRGEGDMKFSRVVKPRNDPAGCAIDAVWMRDTRGPGHTHTKGEVCFCMPASDAVTFDGRHQPWMVLPPGSTHEPTVENGEMLILYWWPEGAVEWK